MYINKNCNLKPESVQGYYEKYIDGSYKVEIFLMNQTITLSFPSSESREYNELIESLDFICNTTRGHDVKYGDIIESLRAYGGKLDKDMKRKVIKIYNEFIEILEKNLKGSIDTIHHYKIPSGFGFVAKSLLRLCKYERIKAKEYIYSGDVFIKSYWGEEGKLMYNNELLERCSKNESKAE